jgi:hypothetical protein
MKIFRPSPDGEEELLKETKLYDTCLYRTHGYSTEEVRRAH